MNEATDPPVVVTGPGGWIGTAMLAHLAASRGSGWSRRVRLFGSAERMLRVPDGSMLRVERLDRLDAAAVDRAMVFHLAYLTKEKADEVGAEPFMAANRAIDATVVAALEAARPHSLFVASSGAAAGAASGRDDHPYGVAKLLQEERFLQFGREHDVPVVAGRIFSVAGPYINKLSSYAISSMLSEALARGAITIAARMPVYRSYLHVLDLCALADATGRGRIGMPRPIDLCGDLVVEMADIASAVADEVGLPRTSIERAAVDWSAGSAYLGNAVDTKTLAGRTGVDLRPFAAQVHDTATYLRDVLGR